MDNYNNNVASKPEGREVDGIGKRVDRHRVFSPYEAHKNKAVHLRSAVAGLDWDKVRGRNKKKVLQAHITVYERTGQDAWHMAEREAKEITRVCRDSIRCCTQELIQEHWLKLVSKNAHDAEKAFTYTFGYKTIRLLQEDVEPVMRQDVAGQSDDYYLSKSSALMSSVELVLIALRSGCDTVKAIAAHARIHRTTASHAIKRMEEYSIVIREGKTIRLNPSCNLQQIAHDLGSATWLEDQKQLHKEERQHHRQVLKDRKKLRGMVLRQGTESEEK